MIQWDNYDLPVFLFSLFSRNKKRMKSVFSVASNLGNTYIRYFREKSIKVFTNFKNKSYITYCALRILYA